MTDAEGAARRGPSRNVTINKPSRRPFEYRNVGGWFRSDERLYIDGRERTKLIDDTAWQVQAVSEACSDLLANTAVRPALCFVDVTVGWFTKPFLIRGVAVLWRSELETVLTRAGPFSAVAIE